MASPFTNLRPTSHPWLKKPSQDALLRQSRRTTTTFEERRSNHDDKEEFLVAGSEGDEYLVTIGGGTKTNLACSCPDKVIPCKHIWFVYLDVLELAKSDPLTWQTALTPKEVYKLVPRLDPDHKDKGKKRGAVDDGDEEEDGQDKKKARLDGQEEEEQPRSFEDEWAEADDLLGRFVEGGDNYQERDREGIMGLKELLLDPLVDIVHSISAPATSSSLLSTRTSALSVLMNILLRLTDLDEGEYGELTSVEIPSPAPPLPKGEGGTDELTPSESQPFQIHLLNLLRTLVETTQEPLPEDIVTKLDRGLRELGMADVCELGEEFEEKWNEALNGLRRALGGDDSDEDGEEEEGVDEVETEDEEE